MGSGDGASDGHWNMGSGLPLKGGGGGGGDGRKHSELGMVVSACNHRIEDAEVGGSPTSLDYTMRPCLKYENRTTHFIAPWHIPMGGNPWELNFPILS